MGNKMSDQQIKSINPGQIKEMLHKKKGIMKRLLSHCVHCGICAESCFLYMAHDQDPQYMPSYKVIHSLGKLYKKKGKVNREALEKMKGIVWRNCVLCGRCYCPIGVHVPTMIAFARSICRSQGVFPEMDGPTGESWL
jgi:Fe-S oxidoreductase